MKTEIIGSHYENGQRVVVQHVTYDKSDDMFTLANLQRRYERLNKQIESSDEEEVEVLRSNLKRVEEEMIEQQAIVDGYEEASK